MAENVVKVTLTEDFSRKLEEVTEEIRAAKEALSEDRIRQIVREEITAWEKQLPEMIRRQAGYRGPDRPMELK